MTEEEAAIKLLELRALATDLIDSGYHTKEAIIAEIEDICE